MTTGEQQAAERLVDLILQEPMNLISVCDGEEWTVKRSRDRAVILAALATTDQDAIRVRDGATGASRGSFDLIWGNADDGSELIADHTDNEFCNRVWECWDRS